MSNEELAAAIQNGKSERIGELWEQVEGLVKWKAKRTMTALELRGAFCGVEFDDLVQCGYPAMAAAVESYSPENGSFSTWFMYYLQKEFAEATGYRTQRGRNEPLNESLSLDKPLSDEVDSVVFGDLVPDQRATATMEAVEDHEYQRQLHEAVEKALSALPADAAEVLRLRNYDGLTLDEAGERLMVSRERIRQLEQKGIRKLREPKIACTLRPFMIFDFYSSTGLSAYRQSGMSIQERYVAMEEEHREREWQRMKAEEERTQEALANAERFLTKYRHEQRANKERTKSDSEKTSI